MGGQTKDGFTILRSKALYCSTIFSLIVTMMHKAWYQYCEPALNFNVTMRRRLVCLAGWQVEIGYRQLADVTIIITGLHSIAFINKMT